MIVGAAAYEQIACLDHVYVVLDADLIAAIEASTFLGTFGPFAQRTVVADEGESWTGRYLLGVSTYLELFGPGDVDDAGVGATGIALSPVQEGGLRIIAERLVAVDEPAPTSRRRTRLADDVQVPWFDLLSPAGDNETLAVWVMEYLEPEAMERRRRSVAGEGPGRQEVALGEEADDAEAAPAPLMRDVVAFEIAATGPDIDRARPLLAASGFRVEWTGNGLVAKDSDTTITLRSVDREAAGLFRIDFRLHESAKEHRERIGRSTLAVGPGDRAVWEFPAV